MHYHVTEVRHSGAHGRLSQYQATCRCGWRGQWRDRYEDAEGDGVAHETTENTEGA